MGGQTVALVGAMVGLAVGGAVGFALGRRLRDRPRRMFWIASSASLLLGMLVIFVGEVAGLEVLTGGGVGLMTGGLNGIRWGFGRLSDAPRPQAQPRQPLPDAERTPDDKRPHPAT